MRTLSNYLAAVVAVFFAAGCAAPASRGIARVVDCWALRYDEGADLPMDRPAHVRAASSLTWMAGSLAVAQDDANFIAVVSGHRVRAIALPPGRGGRRTFDTASGNKDFKMDLESSFVVDTPFGERFFAMGSGSSPRRRSLTVVDPQTESVTVRDGSALFDALRMEPRLAGVPLNIEGVVVTESSVKLLQRGNGRSADGSVTNAIIELDYTDFLAWLEGQTRTLAPRDVTFVDLGAEGGAPYGFTDATEIGGRIVFVAAAEASPDVTRDGPVSGVIIGRLGGERIETWRVYEHEGRPSKRKVEGIAPVHGDPNGLLVVTDVDDPKEPAQLCRLRIDW